jgi:hypothetical protein
MKIVLLRYPLERSPRASMPASRGLVPLRRTPAQREADDLTTVYGIDSGTDSLVLVGGLDGGPSPNGGTLTNVGPLGFDVSDALGFDIVSFGVGLNVAYDTSPLDPCVPFPRA